jgi:hypothetical protein
MANDDYPYELEDAARCPVCGGKELTVICPSCDP